MSGESALLLSFDHVVFLVVVRVQLFDRFGYKNLHGVLPVIIECLHHFVLLDAAVQQISDEFMCGLVVSLHELPRVPARVMAVGRFVSAPLLSHSSRIKLLRG